MTKQLIWAVPGTFRKLEFFSEMKCTKCVLRCAGNKLVECTPDIDSIFQNKPWRAEVAGFMMVLMSVVHSASLRVLRCTTSLIRDEWRNFQKVTETTHTSCCLMIFMSFVHSASFSVERRRTTFLQYESLDNWILQNFLWRPEIDVFMIISTSLVHSASFSLLQRTTGITRYESRINNFSEIAGDYSHLLFYDFDVVSTFWNF